MFPFGQAQSLEIMPGTSGFFADIQWLKPLDEAPKWSIFSRSRATLDLDGQTNLFMGAYLNYTTSTGWGGTILGRISSSGAGGEAGFHYVKATENLLLYALISSKLGPQWAGSWFSILRYQPSLNEKWRLYSSLELYSQFNVMGHVVSVQRVRIGLARWGYQAGIGLNLSAQGQAYVLAPINPGLFLRKQF